MFNEIPSVACCGAPGHSGNETWRPLGSSHKSVEPGGCCVSQ